MKKTKKLLLLLILLPFTLLAQEKSLTLEQAVLGYWQGLYPKTLTDLQWRPDSYYFTYTDNWKAIVQGKTQNTSVDTLITLKKINKQLEKYDIELKYLYQIEWLDKDRFSITQNNAVIIYNATSNKIEKVYKLPENSENIFYNDKAKAVAYTIDNNLYYMNNNGKQIAITDDKDKGIVNGSNYVHRQEFGIDHGIFWSPDGKYIAYYRKDETMVAQYPLVDYTQFPAHAEMIRYPMTGQTSEQVTLVVYNIAENEKTVMQTGEPKDHYLTCVTWEPSSKHIYIAILNRDQNHLWLNKYDISDGHKVKTLFEEKDPKYVEPQHPLYFLPDGKQFLWFSQRDGWQQLYLYDTDGNLKRQVTKGDWVVTELIGISQDGRYVYVNTTKNSPLERHVYRVNILNGRMAPMDKGHGTHEVTVSYDGKYWLDSYNSTETPSKTVLYKNFKQVRTVLDAPNPLADFKLGKMTIGTIKAADGKTDLYYRLILPPDFDPDKKYPTIVYVYGGPHAQLVTDSWLGGARMWQYYAAQKGYVMFTLDNRGSYNRGLEFENVTFRHLGVEEMKDQLKGVEFLRSLPYVDTARMGVHGWSFGGFMTTSLMTTYPGVFKVAVAGGPVIDWKFYEVMYGERYMDTPQSNPEGYKETSVLNKIGNLQGKLLIIHGGVDPVVVPQNSQSLLIEAEKQGKQIDFYTYPTQEHNVRGKLRVHLIQKILDYFDANL